jgi:hypothetical protein
MPPSRQAEATPLFAALRIPLQRHRRPERAPDVPSASPFEETSTEMTKSQIAAEIRKIIKNQLDDCERAIKAGTRSIALYELEDAAKRLKKIADFLDS